MPAALHLRTRPPSSTSRPARLVTATSGSTAISGPTLADRVIDLSEHHA